MDDIIAADKSYLIEFLAVSPIVHALPRSLEAKQYSALEIRPPSMDLGCGDGTFMRILTRSRGKAIDVGIDRNGQELSAAWQTGTYRALKLADARYLPFEDGIFNTILSNSVLEHVPMVDLAISEISRVLAPGGVLAFTVPLLDCSRSLFYPKVLALAGLPTLARLYANTKHNLWRHVNLLDRTAWKSILEDAGLVVKTLQIFNSESAISFCDLIGPLSVPSLLAHRLFNKMIRFHPRWAAPIIAGRLHRYYVADGENGGAAFIVAFKPHHNE